MKTVRNAFTITAVAVMASFTMSLSAATKTWSGGGDGKNWSDPLNWENSAPPVNGQGDLVVLSNAGSTPAITNDLGAISIGKLSVTNGNLALTGGTITFDGTQGSVISANVSLQLSIANDLVLPISRDIAFELPTTFTLTGDVTSPTLSTSRTLSFFSYGSGRTAAIDGDVNLPGWDVKNVVKANSYVQFNGKLICGNVLPSGATIGGDTGDFRLNCTESSFALIRAGYSSVKCMRAEVIDPEAIIEFGGYSEGSTSNFDLNGYDQTVDRVRVTPGSSANNWFKGNFLKSSSAAKLTMNGTDHALACCEVDGAVTLVWNPVGSYETVFSNRVNTTTGDIIVSNGTFKVAGAATFANVKRVEVADGAAFVLDTTSASALTSVTNVTVGADASFTIGASATAPFANSVMSLALDSDATFCIPSGITVLVKELTIDGVLVEGGDYSGASGLKQITGGGTLSVPLVEVETKAGTWNAGALPDENVNTVENWASGFALSDLTSRGLQPLFASAGTQAVFNVKTDFKGVKFGLPSPAETNAFTLKGESGVTMTLRELGIVMEEPGGDKRYRYTIDVPMELKGSTMPWTLASSNATLSVEKPMSGTTDITKTGGATVELRSPNPDFTGAFNFNAGKLKVYAVTNALGSAVSAAAADINGVGGAVATFRGATVDRAITVRCGTSIDSTKFMFADGTTNVLNGALSFLLASGTKGVGGFRVGSGTELVTTGTVLSDVAGMTGGGTWICRGPFSIYNFQLGSGTVVLETTSLNRGDGVQPAMRIYQPDSCIRCTIPNQLNENWNSLDIDNGTFDLNGCDQKFGGLKVNDANTVGGRIYSATPATLTIHGNGCNNTDFYLTKPDIAGAVSLRGPLLSTSTFTIDRAVSTTGSLTVPAGTFVFTANGSWLNGTNVFVEGTGVLKLNHSKTFNNTAVIRVTDTGSIDLASGINQRCAELWLAGNKCAYGTWGSASSGAQHTSSMLTGVGIITILPKGTTLLLY